MQSGIPSAYSVYLLTHLALTAENRKIGLLNPSSNSVVLKLLHVKEDPSILHVFGRRPPSKKRWFQGRPETEILVTKVSFEKNIFKDLNKFS